MLGWWPLPPSRWCYPPLNCCLSHSFPWYTLCSKDYEILNVFNNKKCSKKNATSSRIRNKTGILGGYRGCLIIYFVFFFFQGNVNVGWCWKFWKSFFFFFLAFLKFDFGSFACRKNVYSWVTVRKTLWPRLMVLMAWNCRYFVVVSLVVVFFKERNAFSEFNDMLSWKGLDAL